MQEASEPLLSERENEGNEEEDEEIEQDSKGDFIVRIYRILTVQLLISLGCVLGLVRYLGPFLSLLPIPALCQCVPPALYVLLLFVSYRSRDFLRSGSRPYILLSLISILESLLVTQIAFLAGDDTVLISLTMLIGVTSALMTYAYVAREKFATSMGLPIAVFSTVIVFAACIRVSEDVSRVEVVRSTQLVCTFLAVLYSFYIVVDVQVMALRERFSLLYSEHVSAVVFLRLDVANVLWSCGALALASLPFRT